MSEDEVIDNMVEVDDAMLFNILDDEIRFYGDDTSHGWNIIVEYKNEFYYRGDDPVNIQTAIEFWQEKNQRLLTQEEIKSVMIDNFLAT